MTIVRTAFFEADSYVVFEEDRRKVRKLSVITDNTIFLPFDVINVVLSYIPYNQTLLNGFGLANKYCRLAVLASCKKISINPNNIYNIPSAQKTFINGIIE